MGLLIDGKWADQWYDTHSTGGKFVRSESQFRDTLGSAKFPAEKGRYHLYISMACPWANRTSIFRKLKELETIVSMETVHPLMLEHGWVFHKQDTINQRTKMHEIYTMANPTYSGRVTVPVLWCKQTHQIVNNESSDIIRFFNSAFDELTGNTLDFYPLEFRQQIDEMNTFIYHNINNGVYKVGFSTSQDVYEKAFDCLFNALDKVESILEHQNYLVGNRCTESDWRLFTTLIRFDAVYFGHFKCNQKRIADYPYLSNYLKRLLAVPGVQETIDLNDIKTHYYGSHPTINPTGIIPKGPQLSFDR